MARITPRPKPTREVSLQPVVRQCPSCGHTMWADYDNRRTITTLKGVLGYRLRVRRCAQPTCDRFHQPYRPEAEGALALPGHEFGMDVLGLIGALRYGEHRSVPEIHEALRRRGVELCERTVTNLLDRYDELVALSVTDRGRIANITAQAKRVILAIDGLQPDVGHEVLWVVRDCLSGEILLARSLLSASVKDLSALLQEVKSLLTVPVKGVISDGQHAIRRAVAEVFPAVPHQLCHFHYLREAALPIYNADRHAKKELKKLVRGVRPLERAMEGLEGPDADAVRAYCAAVRSALTDDGRPPLEASGLKLHERLSLISGSLQRVAKKGGSARASGA